MPVFEWLESQAAEQIALASSISTLHDNVANQVAPLLSWWERWKAVDESEGKGPFAELLDFWGRGGLCRVAAAVRPEAHRAVAVDARSIDEIRRWARILCPLFDTVIIKWKGVLGDGVVMCPLQADYAGPGGHGYDVTNEAIYNMSNDPPTPLWGMTVSSASLVPQELARFLADEAMPLMRAGRLVLVPAPLVGCTQRAIGWTDDLFVTGLLGGAVSVIGAADAPAQDSSRPRRILDLSSTGLPYIEDVSLPDLARVLHEANDWLRPARAIILRAINSDDLRHERWGQITIMQNDINDACRELEERYRQLVRTESDDRWRVTTVATTVLATERPDAAQEQGDPITDVLQAIGSRPADPTPWIPYWMLQGKGGYLRWTAPLDNRSIETKSHRPEAPVRGPRLPISSWLHPGTPGWGIRPAVEIACSRARALSAVPWTRWVCRKPWGAQIRGDPEISATVGFPQDGPIMSAAR